MITSQSPSSGPVRIWRHCEQDGYKWHTLPGVAQSIGRYTGCESMRWLCWNSVNCIDGMFQLHPNNRIYIWELYEVLRTHSLMAASRVAGNHPSLNPGKPTPNIATQPGTTDWPSPDGQWLRHWHNRTRTACIPHVAPHSSLKQIYKSSPQRLATLSKPYDRDSGSSRLWRAEGPVLCMEPQPQPRELRRGSKITLPMAVWCEMDFFLVSTGYRWTVVMFTKWVPLNGFRIFVDTATKRQLRLHEVRCVDKWLCDS